MLGVLVVVKQHKLVQYITWIESIFFFILYNSFAHNLSLPKVRNIVIHDWEILGDYRCGSPGRERRPC